MCFQENQTTTSARTGWLNKWIAKDSVLPSHVKKALVDPWPGDEERAAAVVQAVVVLLAVAGSSGAGQSLRALRPEVTAVVQFAVAVGLRIAAVDPLVAPAEGPPRLAWLFEQ